KDQELYKGAKVTIGDKTGVIKDKIGRKIRIDFNHPFAGKDLIYEYTIEEKLEEDIDKIKGLFSSYIRWNEVESISIENKIVTIVISKDLSFNKKWLYLKQVIASGILENIDINSVNYVESYSLEPIEKNQSLQEKLESCACECESNSSEIESDCCE
ncbi:MAG: hypothetical protein HF967_07585, partial [Methanosarcinales archaeon]|nr:hypothetical protein [Methanosarcinales archaeon]